MVKRCRRFGRRLRFSTVVLMTESFAIETSELSYVRMRVLRKPTSSTVPSVPLSRM
jgi:hypothetical protein